jgi:hypothetical protein
MAQPNARAPAMSGHLAATTALAMPMSRLVDRNMMLTFLLLIEVPAPPSDDRHSFVDLCYGRFAVPR